MKKFKAGVTYTLKKNYAENFRWSAYLEKLAGGKKSFTFTCNEVTDNGDAMRGDAFIAYSYERHMFKKVANNE